MFFEIIGRQALPEHLDRDDLEDAIVATVSAADVTGAGVGETAWHLDVEVDTAHPADHVAREIAAVLNGMQLGWVLVLHESWLDGVPARDMP